MEDKTITMPVIALRGMTVLPKMMIHFDISRSKSIAAVEKAMIGDQRVCLVTQKNSEEADPGVDELHSVGCVALIKQLVKINRDSLAHHVTSLFIHKNNHIKPD